MQIPFWLSEIAQVISGVNNMALDSNSEKQRINEQLNADRKAWTMFIGITLIFIVFLIGLLIINKK